MEKVDYLLVGGGLAAAKCAAELRGRRASGRIMIISAEKRLPYNRPPLSKGLLLGYQNPDQIGVFKPDFYQDQKVELVLGSRITEVDGDKKIAVGDDGIQYHFDKMLVATGAAPRHLSVPGADLENIFYLRSLDDSLAINESLGKAQRALIVGAGFIGMELASAFVQKNVETTMLVRDNKLFAKLGSPELSVFFEDYFKNQGVAIVYGDSVDSFEMTGDGINVVTKAGNSRQCDIAAVGIGVIPNTQFLEGSGVEVDNGVRVDEYMRSSIPDIYAAGDVANFYDPIFGKRRRVEHWDNAITQGELAAANMMGDSRTYNKVAYFFSDMFDFSWEWLGDNSDTDTVINRGSLGSKSASVFYLKEGRLRAAFLMMRDAKERKWAEKAIISGVELTDAKQEELADEDRTLDSVL